MTLIEDNGDVFEKIPDNKPGYYNWVGKKSHYLTVIDAYFRITEGKIKQRYFLCKCKCGNTKLIHGDGIRKQRLKSCGCWKSVVDGEKAKSMGDANLKHGLSNSRMYKIWDAMIYRCFNENDRSYDNYGGRGITCDDKWRTFQGFYEDMHPGYSNELTIDRIDVNGDYTKSNCRWITMEKQQSNKRNTIILEYGGKKMTLKEWSKETGITRGALYQRYKSGAPLNHILREYKL